jgi:hypothetical protein
VRDAITKSWLPARIGSIKAAIRSPRTVLIDHEGEDIDRPVVEITAGLDDDMLERL